MSDFINKYINLENIIILFIGVILGILFYHVALKIKKRNSNEPRQSNIMRIAKCFTSNLDNLVLCLAFIILTIGIICQASGTLSGFSSVVINMFSGIIFSWLLTKKSSKCEFKNQEEELALKSYRHINYIESASNTAYKQLENFILDSNDQSVKLILSRAMDQIMYIKGGINTCKMDWYDLLSDEEKVNKRPDEGRVDLYGEVVNVLSNSEINQEDA